MIFSHVLYQLSYPGIAAAAEKVPASDWSRAYDEAAPPWQASISLRRCCFIKKIGIGGWTGQGVAIVEPFDEVAVAAARAAEGGVRLGAGLAAHRAFVDAHAATV